MPAKPSSNMLIILTIATKLTPELPPPCCSLRNKHDMANIQGKAPKKFALILKAYLILLAQYPQLPLPPLLQHGAKVCLYRNRLS